MLRSCVFVLGLTLLTGSSIAQPSLDNPILFVAQVPVPSDFAVIGSTFANHDAEIAGVGRGGDLYIRYPDGSLRNLTREAGFGEATVMQGANAIAVRDPSVHWDGNKALFSMVVGGPARQFEVVDHPWQIYEVTGLGQGETVTITKIANQPQDFNNITPLYAPNGRILFTSDRPRNGARHLYPQHDEYESTKTNTGLWSLDPQNGELTLLDHAPSGNFTPILDSFGRVIFTRWDHLQRDQQADADELSATPVFGTFTWTDEGPNAAKLDQREEVFPEPRGVRTDLLSGTNMNGHRFNHFFPWMIHPDGTEAETLNHIGRHELHTFFNRALNDDPDLEAFNDSTSGRFNTNDVFNLFQFEEDPTQPGLYVGVDAPEFRTHTSGQVFALTGHPSLSADQMQVTYITHPATGTVVAESATAPPEHGGHFRDPLPLADGQLVAAHTFETRALRNEGTRANPVPRYRFRLRTLTLNPTIGYHEADVALTSGINRRVQYFDPDVLVTYDGPLWELSPVEVRSRPMPPNKTSSLPAPEMQIFTEESVDLVAFQTDLKQRGLALVVSRDVTTREVFDVQQPYNLRIAGTSTQTTGNAGKLYDVKYLQFFQGDQIRGIGGIDSPRPGRRVLAQPMHDNRVANPPAPQGPAGSVTLGDDGSMAALVPAHRAMTWQLTAPDGTPIVRERYWLTFQAGEIRVCASCHGLNSTDQANQSTPTNPPEALRTLLQFWQSKDMPIFVDGFESGDTTSWTLSVP